jgi:hypothetical protein
MGTEASLDRTHPQASAYYGLASIAISAIFLLMAVPALQLSNTLAQSHYRGFSPTDQRVAAYGGYAGGGVVILLALTAAGIAVAGIRVSGRTGEPAVLCLVGLLLSLFAALLWIACVASWHSQAWPMLG